MEAGRTGSGNLGGGFRAGVAQWQSSGLLSRGSGVRIPAPAPRFRVRPALDDLTAQHRTIVNDPQPDPQTAPPGRDGVRLLLHSMTKKRRTASDENEPPRLLVPADQLKREIQEQIDLGRPLLDSLRRVSNEAQFASIKSQVWTWSDYNLELLRRRVSNSSLAQEYDPPFAIAVAGGPSTWLDDRREEVDFTERRLRRLTSILARVDLMMDPAPLPAAGERGARAMATGAHIFVVHGRDNARRQEVARFLERTTNKRVLILNELPDKGRTLIEKLEAYAEEAAYAVVILTADDEGGLRGAGTLRPRARQNVIMELGFF